MKNRVRSWKRGLLFVAVSLGGWGIGQSAEVELEVDYEAFLGQHDMLWDRMPHRFELAPYSGNGNIGFLIYRAKSEAKNVVSLHVGRHDYYDHRLPYEGRENLWIYRSRLPLGHFSLESKGDIESIEMRLGLWDAEVTGTITTSEGSYEIHGLTHSEKDIIYFETDAEGESVEISWHPDVPMPPVRESLNAGGGPKGGTWDHMRKDPLPLPPGPNWSEDDGMQFCLQPLHDRRGETTTGWEVKGKSDGRQVFTASIHHSFPTHDSLEIVRENLNTARYLLKKGTLFSTHQKWWHDYYPLSFVTINDPEKEAFYWIQMYKFASATRGNGPIMDLMGPWYNRTFWPMVWGDLNVQLQYWTHLTANRLSVGSSLVNNVDKYAVNLEGNVPDRWEDSVALGALFPQDFVSGNGAKVPDMLVWILNNYWLHCEFAGDRERMRDKLFPVLRKAVNSYFNYLSENPVESNDGKIHIKNSWSPEYKPGHGADINFTIGLMRWACETLIDINEEHGLNDPLLPEWQNILDNLVEFQVDENGLRIGKDIPFDKPHRHYSHLLAFYPLAVLTPDMEEGSELLKTSLDHWLDVSMNSGIKIQAMPVTGYTATGAASMYAMLGDREKAYHYLDFLIKHRNVSTTTMYAEGNGNPVIESPLSFATCVHDMLLQSWGGTIRVFPGAPELWGDVAFHQFRTQGAFLVSAKKKAGVTEFVRVESLIGSPCIVKMDILEPKIYINGKKAKSSQVSISSDGTYEIDAKKGDSVLFTRVALKKADLSIESIPVGESDLNLFGYSDRTERLPGHKFYENKDTE